MKRILSYMIALLVALCGVCGAARAEGAQQVLESEGSATVLVTLAVPAGFKVVIPESVRFSGFRAGAGIETAVEAYDVYIYAGQTLRVSVASANNWTLLNSGSGCGYALRMKDTGVTLQNGDTVLTLRAGELQRRQDMTLTLLEDARFAGTYADSLTFTLSVQR